MLTSLPGRNLRIAIAGVGFIGKVHIEAARRAGATVVGISGGDVDRARSIAFDLGIEQVFTSSEALAASPDIDVVHICTPNVLHTPLARLALENGKHVVCEKPLATNVDDALSLAALARAGGLTATVPFVYRFHPVVRDARARVANGETGGIRLMHGSYQQDWLATPDDYNWRVDPETGGSSQAFADIGTHWCDLVEFVSGHRITRLIARTHTTVALRRASDNRSFEKATSSGQMVTPAGEDAVTMMFETDGGAAGSVVISQVSHGRKNRLWFEIDGANQALSFDQEHAEQLWIGTRSTQQTVTRDPLTLAASAAPYAVVPAGHAQGYADAFHAFVADTYRAVNGETPDGLPVFTDGLRAARITAAVLESAEEGTWKEVRS